MPLARLTLSNLQLPSVKALSNYIQHLYTPYIELNAMTFVKEDVQDIQRRMPHSYSELSNVTVSRYSQDIAGFLRWFNITNMLYACQGCLWVDDAHLALAEKYMSIILSHFPHRDRARRLETRFDRMYPQGENMCYAWPRRGLITSSRLEISMLDLRFGDILAACECISATTRCQLHAPTHSPSLDDL